MTARVDGLLSVVAAELELTVLEVLGGGELGAVLVRDADGDEAVLKALPGEAWAPVFARGATLCGLVRHTEGYPAPRYLGVGTAAGAAWSLQERLPGATPPVLTEPLARRLVELAAVKADRADEPADPFRRIDRTIDGAVDRLLGHDATRTIAQELTAALDRGRTSGLRTTDVVHGDFHHRNVLAVDDGVTGVFDWELAYVGDWRADLVQLACWASWVPDQFAPAAATTIVDAARAACEPAVLATLTAFLTIAQLDFDLRVHPDRLPLILGAVDATTRAWL